MARVSTFTRNKLKCRDCFVSKTRKITCDVMIFGTRKSTSHEEFHEDLTRNYAKERYKMSDNAKHSGNMASAKTRRGENHTHLKNVQKGIERLDRHSGSSELSRTYYISLALYS